MKNISMSDKKIYKQVIRMLQIHVYEPRSEKTGLQGFRPGPTKTGLYSRGLKFQIQKVEGLHFLCSENKGADQFRG